MYTGYYNTVREWTWEPPIDPPCYPPDPEMCCPDCEEEMEWQHNHSKFYCLQCEEHHELPEPDYDFDDYYDDREYRYAY